jgi:hypothetical protein
MHGMGAFWLLALAGAALLAAAGGQQASVPSIITREAFDSMLSGRNQTGCAGGFYTYDAFVQAASKFPGFGTAGDEDTRRRELAAFFGQTSHVTDGRDDTICTTIYTTAFFSACVCNVFAVRAQVTAM